MDAASSLLGFIGGLNPLMQYGLWYVVGACVLAGGFTGIIVVTLVQGLQGRAVRCAMEFIAIGLIFLHAIVGGVLAQAFSYTKSFDATPVYSVTILSLDVILLISYVFPERNSGAIVSSIWTTLLTITIVGTTAYSVL